MLCPCEQMVETIDSPVSEKVVEDEKNFKPELEREYDEMSTHTSEFFSSAMIIETQSKSDKYFGSQSQSQFPIANDLKLIESHQNVHQTQSIQVKDVQQTPRSLTSGTLFTIDNILAKNPVIMNNCDKKLIASTTIQNQTSSISNNQLQTYMPVKPTSRTPTLSVHHGLQIGHLASFGASSDFLSKFIFNPNDFNH